LQGTQCMTVYKAIKREADAAVDLASALMQGQAVAASAMATSTLTDPDSNRQVPSILLEPRSIFKSSVKDVIGDGFTSVDNVCTTVELKKLCKENSVS
jgi:D-xylose transport system substrate-binding protein